MTLDRFLSDYSNLGMVGETSAQYLAAGNRLDDYSKFIIDPIAVRSYTNDQGIEAKSGELEELKECMHVAVQRTIQRHYSVVSQPGPGVARIRIALTDIRGSSPVFSTTQQTEFAALRLNGSSMEAEVVDSITDEQIAAFIFSPKEERLPLVGIRECSESQTTMDELAIRFSQSLFSNTQKDEMIQMLISEVSSLKERVGEMEKNQAEILRALRSLEKN